MFRTAASSLLSLTLLCTSCTDVAGEPAQSLVGAKTSPSAKGLSHEVVYISRGGGPYGGDALTYEWHPDNSLTITHTFSDNSARQTVKGREILRVAPEVAAKARRILSRVRPAKSEGVEQDQRPVGCERQGPHDFGEVTITFVNEVYADRPFGIDDDRIGRFELPVPSSCNTPAAAEARKVVWEALRLLPKSKVAAAFERSA